MKIIIVSLQVCESASKGHLHPAIELAQAAINRQHDVSILPLPSNLGINDQQQINKLNINYIAPPKLPWKIEQSKLAQLAKDANTAHLAYKLFMFDPIEHQIKEINKIFNVDKNEYKFIAYLCFGYTKEFYNEPELKKLKWNKKRKLKDCFLK